MAKTPFRCGVCVSENRAKIEDAIIAQWATRNIATKYGVAVNSILHHTHHHIPADMLKAYQQLRRMDEVIGIPDKMAADWEHLEQMLDLIIRPISMDAVEAKEAGLTLGLENVDMDAWYKVMRLRFKFFDMMLRVMGALPQEQVVNIVTQGPYRAIMDDLRKQLGEGTELKARLGQFLTDIPAEYRIVDEEE